MTASEMFMSNASRLTQIRAEHPDQILILGSEQFCSTFARVGLFIGGLKKRGLALRRL